MNKRRGNTAIPYAQRLQAKKAQEIGDQREDAAVTAMMIMIVKLADRGWGYDRLTRLCRDAGQEIRDYYFSDDPEVEQAHLHQRLEQIGFQFSRDGKLIAALDEEGNPIRPAKLDEKEKEIR